MDNCCVNCIDVREVPGYSYSVEKFCSNPQCECHSKTVAMDVSGDKLFFPLDGSVTKSTSMQVDKFLKDFDFKGLAEAYRKSEMAWSANEWKEFIEKIRAEQNAEFLKMIEEMKVRGGANQIAWVDDEELDVVAKAGFNKALEHLKEKLK